MVCSCLQNALHLPMNRVKHWCNIKSTTHVEVTTYIWWFVQLSYPPHKHSAIAMPALAHVTLYAYLLLTHCCGGGPHASMHMAQIVMMPSQYVSTVEGVKSMKILCLIRLGVGVWGCGHAWNPWKPNPCIWNIYTCTHVQRVCELTSRYTDGYFIWTRPT